MKAATIYGERDLRIEEVPVPEIGREEVLIKVKACGVCGTDFHIYEGEVLSSELPIVPGHEFSGKVVKAGADVEEVKAENYVIIDPNIACGKCYFCRTGNRHFCAEWKAVGITADGAFAEYVKAPAEVVYKMPSDMSFDEGSFTEPVACCLHGIRRLGIKPGEVVAVFGLGPIGLIHMQLAEASGASQVIGVDVIEGRLDKAEELGTDITIDAEKEDSTKVIKELTNGLGADAAIEASGNPSVFQQSIQAVGYGGKVLAFGAPEENAQVSLKPFDIYRREITIMDSFTNPYTMNPAMKLISSAVVKVSPLITHRFPIESASQTFKIIRKKRGGVTRVMIKPELEKQRGE